MSKGKIVFLLYQKDFSEKGNDRYFIYDDSKFEEVDSESVVSLDCFLVTHDFWLIASSLYKKHNKLPRKVIDIVLLAKIVAGIKHVNGSEQPWDISKTIRPIFTNPDDFDNYLEMYYRRKTLSPNLYMLFSHKLSEYFDSLHEKSAINKESDRFYEVELPIYNLLTLAACKGIRINNSILRTHKENLYLDFYRELKSFSEKHNVLYEIPNEGSIREKLAQLGYQVQDYSLEFLIDFLPSRDGYTDDFRRLEKLNKSYRIFNSISSSTNRITPIVESHWTSTSRVYHKSPSLQNISKIYRNIFIADEGKSLCYIDYDQFEVGVMAALSNDNKMIEIYNNHDAYKDLAIQVFNNENMRKKAKIMFLSYTYGMSMENILSSVTELGGNRKQASDYFSEFTTFEKWKSSVYDTFVKENRIGTINGNYLNRISNGVLTEKEKRKSVNHVIQGTATYIFKRAILKLAELKDFDILIPMHDAVLFQHPANINPAIAKEIFESVMSEILPRISGKASIEDFYVSPS
ncbi:hypothetical protein KW514_10765 [Vibrio fluvialis]|nr:hypothetical protein [Vibrio fluvialis]